MLIASNTFADTLRDIGTLALAITGILALIGILGKLRPVKYVWSHLVTRPLTIWFRSIVREEVEDAVVDVKAQLQTNGGTTVKDRIEQALSNQFQMEARLSSIEKSVQTLIREDVPEND